MQRAAEFSFQSGAFAQLSLPDISTSASHPFTIMSAPQEQNIHFAIRSNGVWTSQLFQRVVEAEKAGLPGRAALRQGALLRGPYGAPTQRWFKAHHVVLVGGGVGITPMLATARDFILRHDASWRGHQHSPFKTERMHLCWVTRTQKELQWLIGQMPDLQRVAGVFSLTIYLTRVSSTAKLPLRKWFTPLLGLNPKIASVRFGRPAIKSHIVEQLKPRMQARQTANVFVCGPSQLVRGVKHAVTELRAEQILPGQVHAFDEVFEW